VDCGNCARTFIGRCPGAARAVEPFRIGRRSPNSAEADASNLRAFRDGIRELGWEERRDYAIEARFADGRFELLPGIGGAKPSDLPIEQPTRLDLVVNKAARAIGITLPRALVSQADQVIE